MEKGEEAVQNEDYEEAITYYAEAVELKSDKEEPESYLSQVENMQAGLTDLDNGYFEDAEAYFNEILEEDEYLILEEEANKQLKKVEEQNTLASEIDETYDKAETLHEEMNYQEALNVIEETLEKDLSHASIEEQKDKLEALQEDIEEDQSNKEEVQETMDQAIAYIEEEEYKKAKELLDNNDLGEYMTQDEGKEFAALSDQIKSQVPSLSAKEIKSGEHDGDYVKMGGPVTDVYDVRELEGFRLKISEDAQKPSEDEWRNFQGEIDVLFDENFDAEELEGISLRDEVYFYGNVRGEVDMTDRYGQEYTTGVVNLEEVDEVIVEK